MHEREDAVEPHDLLVIGAGHGQVPAITTAQRMGLSVVAIDRDPAAPGMRKADLALVVDVADIQGAVRVARETAVRGVMTMQSDLPVPTVGAINDALGLTGVSSATARHCSNKILMRECFRSAGVPQPAFEAASSLAEAKTSCSVVGFPCVVKAPDSSGSRGVVKVDSPQELAAAFEEAMVFSRDGRVLVEEFIRGEEFGAQSFSLRGTTQVVHVHNDMVSDPPYMIPVGHAYPSTLGMTQVRAIESAVANAVDALGIGHGPANIDFMLASDGSLRIIEIGARVGATCLPELTSIHTGTDWVAAAVQAATGESPDVAATASVPVAAFILDAPRDGRLAGWDVPQVVREDPRVLEWEVTAQTGDVVSRLTQGTDRIGKVVATGSDVREAVEVADRFRRSVEFVIR